MQLIGDPGSVLHYIMEFLGELKLVTILAQQTFHRNK